MKHPLPSLEALKVFESAARQLSFSEAARELCITKGAVSYQIRRLEEALDCALFQRTVRQVFLTRARSIPLLCENRSLDLRSWLIDQD
ncbi:MAG: LysR family transcriptional regulator [Gammaproteobacteria bacterium]|nr:LysR family transcriptional regulator [Gammaproteobacteria bacterium]